MFSSKKAMELSVNMVVMLIIGILLFGLGMGLFAKISASAEDEIRKMNDDVRTGISALECNTDDWICAPTMALDAGEEALFRVYMTNKNNQADEFKISISGVSGPDYELSSDDCGHISIYAANVFAAVGAEDSASFPSKFMRTVLQAISAILLQP